MEEELREQPSSEPANALDLAEEKSAVSEDGSQGISLGKFKNVQALLDAYNNLEAQFTKKCQMLSEIEKDKMNLKKESQFEEKNQEKGENNQKNDEKIDENDLNSFLKENSEAKDFSQEIESRLNEKMSPYGKAWASVVLSHLKNEDNKTNDPIINQYVLNDENIKSKIIKSYLKELETSKPPIVISSFAGDRVSTVKSDSPKTLAEAKETVSKMFS